MPEGFTLLCKTPHQVRRLLFNELIVAYLWLPALLASLIDHHQQRLAVNGFIGDNTAFGAKFNEVIGWTLMTDLWMAGSS